MLAHYRGSPVNAVLDIYPNHQWQRWKFSRSSPGYWKDIARRFSDKDKEAIAIVTELVDSVAKHARVTSLEDWYRVSRSQVGSTTLEHLVPFGGLPAVIPKVFPKHKWDLSKFLGGKAAEQRALVSNVDQLLPTEQNK